MVPSVETASKTRLAFGIEGGDGQAIAIKPGDFYFNTKARCRRLMLNHLTSEARQVYAYLEISTMGFQQELAVTMHGGKMRSVTPSDIAAATGLSKQNVRRALAELEDEGLVERRSTDGGPLRNGKIEIYSWAVPRPPKEKKGSRARLPFPDWFPESWEPLRPLINRLKIRLSPDLGVARDYLIEEGERAARDYHEAEKVVCALLERVRAQSDSAGASLLIERTERTKRNNPPPPQLSSTPPAPKAEEEDDRSLPEKFQRSYPQGHFDEGKAMQIFNSKKKDEQRKILERLEVYRACPRWQDDDGQWIPLASNWLKTCHAEPPPAVKKGKIHGHRPATDELDAIIEEARAREKAEAQKGGS